MSFFTMQVNLDLAIKMMDEHQLERFHDLIVAEMKQREEDRKRLRDPEYWREFILAKYEETRCNKIKTIQLFQRLTKMRLKDAKKQVDEALATLPPEPTINLANL